MPNFFVTQIGVLNFVSSASADSFKRFLKPHSFEREQDVIVDQEVFKLGVWYRIYHGLIKTARYCIVIYRLKL